MRNIKRLQIKEEPKIAHPYFSNFDLCPGRICGAGHLWKDHGLVCSDRWQIIQELASKRDELLKNEINKELIRKELQEIVMRISITCVILRNLIPCIIQFNLSNSEFKQLKLCFKLLNM